MKRLLMLTVIALAATGCNQDEKEENVVVTDGTTYAVKTSTGIYGLGSTCEQARELKKSFDKPYDHAAFERSQKEISSRNWKRADCQ